MQLFFEGGGGNLSQNLHAAYCLLVSATENVSPECTGNLLDFIKWTLVKF